MVFTGHIRWAKPFMAKQKAGLNVEDNSVLYLILQLFGLGIVNYALMQNELNQLAGKEAGVR